MKLKLQIDVCFPDPIRVIIEQPVARLAFTTKGPNPIMPTPISTLSVDQGATSPTIELDKFAADGTDLGADTDNPTYTTSVDGIASVNDLGNGQLTIAGVAPGVVTVTGTDSSGKSATLDVTVNPPAVDHLGFVSLP